MKCGAKCFVVEMEMDGKIRRQPVTARTSAAARKVIRKEYGKAAEILTVREDKRTV